MAEETEAEDRDEEGEEDASEKRTRPYQESVDEQSDVDAMGQDKRREVVGGQYGATVRKRVIVYGAALAVMVGIVVAFLTVVTGIDSKEIALEDTAPWTDGGGAEVPPRDIDYKANGPNDTIPVEEITNR